MEGLFTITERAASKVREIATAESLDGQGLRLRVIGGGCAGFSYDLYFEDKPTDMDEAFENKLALTQKRRAAFAANSLAILTNFLGTRSYFHKVMKNINKGG